MALTGIDPIDYARLRTVDGGLFVQTLCDLRVPLTETKFRAEFTTTMNTIFNEAVSTTYLPVSRAPISTYSIFDKPTKFAATTSEEYQQVAPALRSDMEIWRSACQRLQGVSTPPHAHPLLHQQKY